MSFQLSANKICLSSILYYLKLNSGIGYQEACSLRYMPSPFYSASVVLFQLHGDMVSHMQALAIPSSTVHNTWILTTESISVLAVCS